MQCLHIHWIFVQKNLSVTFFVMNEKNLARDKMGKPNNFWFTVWIFNEFQNAIKDEWSGALLHQTFFCVKFDVHWWGKKLFILFLWASRKEINLWWNSTIKRCCLQHYDVKFWKSLRFIWFDRAKTDCTNA